MLREDIELEHFVITVIFDLKILEKEEEDRAEEHFQAGFMSEFQGRFLSIGDAFWFFRKKCDIV